MGARKYPFFFDDIKCVISEASWTIVRQMGLAVQPNPNSGNKSSPAPEWLLLLSAFYFFLFAFVLYISCTFQFEIQFFIRNNNSNLGPESLMPGPPHFAKNNTIISLQL